ncbi:MAG TPA: TraX family protein, partial [Mobilitalea sp.]|nr:TraX family protein [Mobilitalea sp.]
MSTFALKMVAIIAMLIDHTAAVLVPQGSVYYIPMRCIGRLAFPIFCYLIVEGFNHTSNVKKYIIRLGLFALISEIPFDLAFYHEHFGSEFIKDFQGAIGSKYFILHLISYQNVFFTLFLGLCLITIMNMVEKKFDKQVIIINILNGLATIAFSILAA